VARWKGGTASLKTFEYANPTTIQDALGFWATSGPGWRAGGGYGPRQLMKEHYQRTPGAGEHQNIQRNWRASGRPQEIAEFGAMVTMDELARNAEFTENKGAGDSRGRHPQSQIPHMGRWAATLPNGRACVLQAGLSGRFVMLDGKYANSAGRETSIQAHLRGGPAYSNPRRAGAAFVSLGAK